MEICFVAGRGATRFRGKIININNWSKIIMGHYRHSKLIFQVQLFMSMLWLCNKPVWLYNKHLFPNSTDGADKIFCHFHPYEAHGILLHHHTCLCQRGRDGLKRKRQYLLCHVSMYICINLTDKTNTKHDTECQFF